MLVGGLIICFFDVGEQIDNFLILRNALLKAYEQQELAIEQRQNVIELMDDCCSQCLKRYTSFIGPPEEGAMWDFFFHFQ